MGKCKYCGQAAGFFSRSHKICEEKHDQGLAGLAGMLKKYFQGAIAASRMGQNIRQNNLKIKNKRYNRRKHYYIQQIKK